MSKLGIPCAKCIHWNVCRWVETNTDSDCFWFRAYEEQQQWIPCTERLSEECENVLAWIERDAWIDGRDEPIKVQECAIGWHIDGRWHFDGYCGSTTECIAWMPLPEPYQKEGESE